MRSGRRHTCCSDGCLPCAAPLCPPGVVAEAAANDGAAPLLALSLNAQQYQEVGPFGLYVGPFARDPFHEWFGNFAGDLAWTVEPALVLLAASAAKAAEKAAKKAD